MSSGRRQPPIALFSFQDIITGVAGIMIFVALMLALEVIRAHAEIRRVPAPPEQDNSVTEQEIARLEGECIALRKTLEHNQAKILTLSRWNPSEVATKIAAEEARRADLVARLESLRSALMRCQRVLMKTEEDNAISEKKTKAAEKRLARLQAQLRSARRVRFKVSSVARMSPILVECSVKGITAQALQNEVPPRHFVDTQSISHLPGVKRFVAWARTLDKDSFQFVVFIKPSAAGYAERVVDQLREAGFLVGYEPLEEGRTIAGDEGKK